MILRYANFLNAELPQNYDKTLFSDDGSISNYAKDAVYQCQISGLVNGTGNGMFSPKGNSSRAQATAILHRFTERALFEVDAYEYLKEWVKQNGEIDGSYSQIVYQQETERYIVSYCANGDYLSVSKSYVYKGEYICLDFFR